MSVEALTWALNLAPVPVDSNGKPNDSCAFVLVGLANHAGPDGKGAFPSVKTLMRYTRKSERTVRSAMARLEADGLIRPCDPAIVAAHIKRADRRPRGWDLALTRVRTDLDEDDLAALEAQFPGITARVEAARKELKEVAHNPGDNPVNGVRRLHLVPATGCNQQPNGVQPLHPRGAVAAPEQSFEPSLEPPPPRARANLAVVDVDGMGGGGVPGSPEETCATPVEVFIAELGAAWPLSTRQIDRLAPAISAALADGWHPAALAEHAGANTDGVRNAFAVLGARLADLPAPPKRLARSPDPAHRSVAQALTAACTHGAPDPAACAFCRRGITPRGDP